VDDIVAEWKLEGQGRPAHQEKPYFECHKNLVAFVNPKSTRGVLCELIAVYESEQRIG